MKEPTKEIPLISRSGATEELLNHEFQQELFKNATTVLALRKVREALVASKRIDVFAIQVYEKSVEIAILEQNLPELLLSLAGLTRLSLQLNVSGDCFHLHLLLLIAHDRGMLELIPLIQKYPRQGRAIEWYQAKQTNNYVKLSKLWNSFSEKERFIVSKSIPGIRDEIKRILKKGYRSLPESLCREWLLMGPLDELEFEIDSGTVYFKRK